MSEQPELVICRCPTHDLWAITLDVAGGGSRVTPSKCCGRWDTVQTWRLSANEWRRLAEEAEAIADIVEQLKAEGR
jgi:hypothetical protein